ncbi:hypothetical protein SAMN05443549_103144 [Flavobacterium fluvii]|uniref:Uncharacterized protein n=1 Tax=Flavobacterium fluvii TaxID=468056 RepID=A0A1M5ILA8_9FLAO|nr:hypothetical protein SAMN05443549_103144 [Flavobacterium fluvii]
MPEQTNPYLRQKEDSLITLTLSVVVMLLWFLPFCFAQDEVLELT